MNKRKFITKARVEEVAKFLQESVEWLKAQNCGCCHYNLDSTLAIYVGWSNGFDMADEDIIKSPSDQHPVNNPSHPWVCGWAIDAAVKIRNDYDCADFEYLDFPSFEDSGECWDNSLSLRPNMSFKDYKMDAKWFLSEYVAMVNEGRKKNTTLRFGR